jgi:hypothetical protein
VVVASVLRLSVHNGQVRFEVSADGVRAAIAIVSFWTIAGLRMAFVSPGNRQGSWVFRIVHGRPPRIDAALHQLQAGKHWTLFCAGIITLIALAISCSFAPAELRTRPAIATMLLVAAGLCLLLTDFFFINVKTVAFSGEPAREQTNLALTVLKFFTLFPILIWIPVAVEPWIEAAIPHFLIAAAAIAAAHFALEHLHRRMVQEHCSMPGLEDGEDDFPMKLGLRY